MVSGGDLGRRVAERRQELGLDLDEVAERAGMSPTYLRLLETNPAVQPSPAGLLRLASALDTTVETLSGAGMEAPPGRGHLLARPELQVLDVGECRRLIAPGGVGRVVFVADRGPVALPANFRCLDDDVVYRTEGRSSLVPPDGGDEASFEVDHLDDALTEGWSVLLTGTRRLVTDPDEASRVWTSGVTPWADGDRDTLVRIAVREVSGRRIRQRAGGAGSSR